nr:MAG: hypothetical protein EDM05_07695 [Leptolyngbya sp. IPPAS B-1204]
MKANYQTSKIMNIRHNSLITKAIGFVSASAVAALVGLPAIAQSTIRYDVRPGAEAESPSSPAPSAGTATTDPAYGNPSVDQSNRPMQRGSDMNSPESSERGPSTVGEGVPGPSETPSGSPSVPGTSTYDDPNEATETDASEPSNPVRREASNESNRTGGSTQGPSVVPGEAYPGPSETPSGSPSVPGNSNVDDPGNRRLSPTPERDALNDTSDTDEMDQNDDMNQTGPSIVPGETYPGPSETPSGSPNVPGNSEVDDPGRNR